MDKRLYLLYKADQGDRSKLRLGDKVGMKKMGERDRKRQREVITILRNKKSLTASDYYRAAMIFQHASGKVHKKAILLAKKSMDMGHVRAKWLYAAAVDRALVSVGKKQKFGTQFRVLKDDTATPFPIDKRTSDTLRLKYNVPPIAEAKKKIKAYWEGK